MKSVSPIFLPSAKTSRCCNTGYPVLADPQTGKTVCSCQLQTGVPAYLARVPRLPETLCNQSTMNISTESPLGGEHGSAFYTTHALEKHRSSLNMHTSAMHPYYLDQAMPPHPYGTLYPGYDFNGARRKSTSREATGPLKAWLYQHRKNPYPTKGEKVMLAIISQMTLTQVSTWFANARRRLKKEAKSDDKGLDLTDIDVNDTSLQNDSICSRFSDSDSESVIKVSTSDISDISDNEEQSGPAKMCMQRLFSPDGRTDVCLERTPSIENLNSTASNGKDIEVVDNETEIKNVDRNTKSERTNDVESKPDDRRREENLKSTEGPQNKPKIWSIAQIIG